MFSCHLLTPVRTLFTISVNVFQLVHCHSSLSVATEKDVVKIHHHSELLWERFASYSTVTLWIVALGDQRRENFMELLDGRFKFNWRCGSVVGWWMRLTHISHDWCGFVSSTLKTISNWQLCVECSEAILKGNSRSCPFAECPWVFVMRVLLLVLVLFKQASWEVLLLLYALKMKYPSAAPWRNNQLRTDQRFPTSAHYSPSTITWTQGVSESRQSWRPITKSIVTWHSPASFSNRVTWHCWGFTTTDSWVKGVRSLLDASQYTILNIHWSKYTYVCP